MNYLEEPNIPPPTYEEAIEDQHSIHSTPDDNTTQHLETNQSLTGTERSTGGQCVIDLQPSNIPPVVHFRPGTPETETYITIDDDVPSPPSDTEPEEPQAELSRDEDRAVTGLRPIRVVEPVPVYHPTNVATHHGFHLSRTSSEVSIDWEGIGEFCECVCQCLYCLLCCWIEALTHCDDD